MKKIGYLLLSFVFVSSLVVLVNAQGADTIAPADTTDLTVSETTESSVTLTWTAPGDDNMIGTSTSYTLRYATSTLTESNWGSALNVNNEPTPQIASSTETMIVSGLEESTTYYFALKTKDEEDNESNLSNVATGNTLTPEPVCGDGNIDTGEECDDSNMEDGDGCSATCQIEEESEFLSFGIKITPSTLNLTSHGKWITVHLFVNSSYNVTDVDISTIKINNSLLPDGNYKGLNYFTQGNKNREKNTSNLVLKFLRSEFTELVGSNIGDFEITLTGKVNGESFSATDTIKIINITSMEVDEEEEEIIVQVVGQSKVYRIKNNKRRHIPSVAAFNRYGYKWNQIRNISQEELDAYLDDELLKDSEQPAVYLICNGLKRHIPSPAVFNSYGFDWDDISIVDQAEINDYFNVNLIRAAGDTKVYLLASGKKHWIPSLAVFNNKGYKWENVIIVNQVEKESIEEGELVE